MTKLTMLTATVAVGALLTGCGSLSGGNTASRQTSASTAAAQPAPSAQVRQVQQSLNAQGFYSGEADGLWGPRTSEALRSFQQARGLDQTGQMDGRTMAALGLRADGTPMSQTQTGAVPPPAPAPVSPPPASTGMSGTTPRTSSATGTTTGTASQPGSGMSATTTTTTTPTTRSAAPAAPGTSSTRTPGNDRQNQQSAITPPQRPAYGTASSARTSADLDRRPDQRVSASGKVASPSEIRQVQESLERAGHDVGDVDGIWGPRTAKALRDYQRAKGLDATGRLDERTLEALGVRLGRG